MNFRYSWVNFKCKEHRYEKGMANPCFREAKLYEKIDNMVKCKTCERFCVISIGKTGFCQTRKNVGGKLYTLEYGNISSISANPIEKKPLFHFYPGSFALTVGSWSCNFTCPWCQNYEISKFPPTKCNYISPEDFIKLTKSYNCQGVSISFNEPTLMLEYSLDVFSLAKKEGLYTTFVTNGYMSLDTLKLLIENGLDAMNVDIKGDGEVVKKYCNADVEKIWRNCKEAKKRDVWIEITTLVIPGINDGEDCLREIAGRIKDDLGKETPWHVTRYYPAYKSREIYNGLTPIETLENAWKIGKEEGLEYVYVGNVPGHKFENTYCPGCKEMLIRRLGFKIVENKLKHSNKCPSCGREIPIVR